MMLRSARWGSSQSEQGNYCPPSDVTAALEIQHRCRDHSNGWDVVTMVIANDAAENNCPSNDINKSRTTVTIGP